MIFGFLPLATTPTGPTDPGGWTVLPLLAFPGVALLGGVATQALANSRDGRLPDSRLSLLVPISAVAATLLAIVAWNGFGAVSLTEWGFVYLLIGLAVGGALVAGSALSARDRIGVLVGTVLFLGPILVGPVFTDTGASRSGFVALGIPWGIVSVCAGYLGDRLTSPYIARRERRIR